MGNAREWKGRREREPQAPTAPSLTPVQQHRLAKTTVAAPPARPKARGAAAAKSRAVPIAEGFAADVEGLHGLTIEAKVERKTALIERYRSHVEALLNARVRGEALFTWWIVWHVDVGRIDLFIALAQRAIALDWRTAFKSDLRTFLYDKVFEWAKAEFEAGRGVEPYFGQIYAEAQQMLEVVRAKYHKLAGDLALKRAEEAQAQGDEPGHQAALKEALSRFELAEKAYGKKAGVQTRIEDVKKFLKKLFS